MKMRRFLLTICMATLAIAAVTTSGTSASEDTVGVPAYDANAYTEYVETTMKELDRLYLEFCAACGKSGPEATKARQEFLVLVRDLMQNMNKKFDGMDPKMAAALSQTETLVSVHALTMVVDILAATQLEQLAAHPYIN